MGWPTSRVRFGGAAAAAAVVAIVVAVLAQPAGPAPAAAPEPVPVPVAAPTPVDHPVVVIGASISAGVGSSSGEAWPALVGRCLGRRVVTSAVPGVGYVNPGKGRRGPVPRLVREAGLARLAPSLVVLQVGHNDIGTAPTRLAPAVVDTVSVVQHDAPGVPIVLITVFEHEARDTAAARLTDTTIVSAARRADPRVVVLDPLAEGWTFPRIADGLHPTAAGQRVLAGRVLDGLGRAALAGSCVPPSGGSVPF